MEAKQITENDAAIKAQQYLSRHTRELKGINSTNAAPTLAYEIKDDAGTQVYAFNASAGKGFVLVSGDDATSSVLGYSDNGSFDYNSLPENAKAWIDGYAQQIRQIQKGAKAVTQPTYTTSVSPLLGDTKWGQDAPYYGMTPTLAGKHCVTGCVATAMAQILYYHKWPVNGVGAISYTSKDHGFELSEDFTKINLEWDKMLPSYTETSSQESKDAVAKLMLTCGIVSKMDYDTISSGANTDSAAINMYNHLNLDKGMRYLKRVRYQYNDWCNIMKNELDASRPIMYQGATGGMFSVSHQFVCDGYNEDGLFHINWGWYGVSDGYYALSILSPQDQGTGGGGAGISFSEAQSAIIGIQKPTSNPIIMPYSFSCSTLTGNIVDKKLEVAGEICNDGIGPFNGKIYLKLYDSKSGDIAYSQEIFPTTDIEVGNKLNFSRTVVNIPSTLQGSYVLGLYSIDSASNNDEIRTNFTYIHPTVTISGSNISVDQSNHLVLSNLKYKFIGNSIFFGADYVFSFDVTNPNDWECEDEIMGIPATFEPHQTISFDKENNYEFEKTYYIYIRDIYGNSLNSEPIIIVVPEYYIFQFEKVSIPNASGLKGADFKLDATIRNATYSDYDGPVYCKIYKANDNAEMQTITTSVTSVSSGTFDMEVKQALDLPEGDYYAQLYYDLEEGQGLMLPQETNKFPFTIKAGGVEEVSSDKDVIITPNPVNDIFTLNTNLDVLSGQIFSIDGKLQITFGSEKTVDASSLSKGLYMVKVLTSQGSKTIKMVKE